MSCGWRLFSFANLVHIKCHGPARQGFFGNFLTSKHWSLIVTNSQGGFDSMLDYHVLSLRRLSLSPALSLSLSLSLSDKNCVLLRICFEWPDITSEWWQVE